MADVLIWAKIAGKNKDFLLRTQDLPLSESLGFRKEIMWPADEMKITFYIQFKKKLF